MVIDSVGVNHPDAAVHDEVVPAKSGARTWVGPVAVASTVVLLAQLPVLFTRSFYFWDDSAAQFLPTWYAVGMRLRDGELPLLDLDLWMGGNLAAEALFGLWNPVCMSVALLCSFMGDLAVAGLFVKTVFMVQLALGVYWLAQEYRATPGASAVVAVAAPVAGFTLYFDASLWASGLIAFSFVPHLWWVARRSALGKINPGWVFLVGYLTVTVGNPYGVLGACFVFAGLLVEFLVARDRCAVRSAFTSGLATALCVPLVYLPLVFTSPVTWRAQQSAAVSNSGDMAPTLSDVLNFSTPSFAPWIEAFGIPFLSVPATYFAWFALPLIPWLDWRWMWRQRWAMIGLITVLAVALLMSIGPSQVWLFRWPLRLVPLFLLGVGVILALALSRGIRLDAWRSRFALSAALVLLGCFMAFSARPDLARYHLLGALVVLGLVALTLVAAHQRPVAVTPVLVAGTAVVLALQLSWFPVNQNVLAYQFPTSVDALQEDFGDRYSGRVMQVAAFETVEGSTNLDRVYENLLFGSMLHLAGVDSVNTYTGLGLQAMSDALCMNYQGSVCSQAFGALFVSEQPGEPTLADLMRLDTVVVQRSLMPTPVEVPPGWVAAEHNEIVTVLERSEQLQWRGSTLSGIPADMVVDASRTISAYDEVVQINDTGRGGWITFGRLAWPGYVATLDGAELDTRVGRAGLLQVEVPPGTKGLLEVEFRTPGLRLGAAALLVGLMIAVAHGGWRSARGLPGRRRNEV